jgi:hypothetical protein
MSVQSSAYIAAGGMTEMLIRIICASAVIGMSLIINTAATAAAVCGGSVTGFCGSAPPSQPPNLLGCFLSGCNNFEQILAAYSAYVTKIAVYNACVEEYHFCVEYKQESTSEQTNSCTNARNQELLACNYEAIGSAVYQQQCLAYTDIVDAFCGGNAR